MSVDRRYANWEAGAQMCDEMVKGAGLPTYMVNKIIFASRNHEVIANKYHLTVFSFDDLKRYFLDLTPEDFGKFKNIGPKAVEALKKYQAWAKDQTDTEPKGEISLPADTAPSINLTDDEFINVIKNHMFRFTNKQDALIMVKINRYIRNHWDKWQNGNEEYFVRNGLWRKNNE